MKKISSILSVLFLMSTILVSYSCQNNHNNSFNDQHISEVNTIDSVIQNEVKIYCTSKVTEERLTERDPTSILSVPNNH